MGKRDTRWLRFGEHCDLRHKVLESFRFKDTMRAIDSKCYSPDADPKDRWTRTPRSIQVSVANSGKIPAWIRLESSGNDYLMGANSREDSVNSAYTQYRCIPNDTGVAIRNKIPQV